MKPLAGRNELARRFLFQCYIELGQAAELVKEFYPPTTDSEAIHVADALWETGEREKLAQMLRSEFVQNCTNPAVMEIRHQFEERLKR